MLPIAFTLMAEAVPAAHRGWLLVALGGIGTSAGYLAAAGAASIFEPTFSWRALWLLNLPTGALIVFLNRFIPESPRFLSNAGLHEQARAVLARFSGGAQVAPVDDEADPPLLDEHHAVVGMRQLLHGRHARISLGLVVCGLAWGLVNFGFLMWLPGNPTRLGVDAHGASTLLAQSALLAMPGIALVVWLYQRWSSIKCLVLFIALTALALLAFCAIALLDLHLASATVAATVLLLVAISGVIAASSKAGGILGAGLGVLGLFDHLAISALAIAVPMAIAAIMLLRSGIETRGQRLEEIQVALSE
jgi:putative MFS transporter